MPALLEPYTRTSLEYYGDVPRVDTAGLRSFLRDYGETGTVPNTIRTCPNPSTGRHSVSVDGQ